MTNNRRTILNKSYMELKQLEGKRLYGAKQFGTAIGINRRTYLWIASKIRIKTRAQMDDEKVERLYQKYCTEYGFSTCSNVKEVNEYKNDYHDDAILNSGAKFFEYFKFSIYGTCINKEGKDVTIFIQTPDESTSFGAWKEGTKRTLENYRPSYFFISKVVSDDDLEEW